MQDEKIIMFRNRLTKVFRHVSKWAKRAGISCYRVYDHDLPEFPLCIEFYGDKLYVAEYKRRHGMTDEKHNEWMKQTLDVISEILNVPEQNISLKLRQRKAGRLGQYQKQPIPNPFRGNGLFANKFLSANEFIVKENSLSFIINLASYLDTGLFLDHRTTRQMVQGQAANKRVLNLFCYTGSFSVYAAAGGAAEVISVDMSNTYLKWAERNMNLNNFTDKSKYKFILADVLQYLKCLPANYFDRVVMDPPTFSNSKKMKDFLDIQRDHVRLINDCLRAMTPNGILYFSTNYSNFILDKGKIAANIITDITKATTPFDFEGKLFRFCFRIEK